MERRSIAGGQLRRVSSRNALKRSLSAPLLTPLWEPHEDVPAYLHSEPGKSPARALHPGGPSVSGRGPAAGGPWNKVLLMLEQQLLLSPVAQQVDPAHLAALTSAPTTMEFLAAVHDGIRRDSQPMRLQTGLVEKRYDIKQLLSSGVSYKVMEGVHRETLKNHSLKIVGRGGRAKLRVVKALDALQVYELIASFVDEVFFHPNYVCICFKWGTHEVDSSHQLTAWIVDSLHLLRELLPPKQHTHFRLDVQDMQRLLLRATCLDCYLQSDLFIQ